MKIQKILNQHRRDFVAVYECEHCGETHENYGYDDSYFHNKVIPDMKCKKCGKKSGDNYRPLATKHAEHEVV